MHWRNRHNSPATGYDQGHIIGGGSSVMGMVALRGVPEDYDEWDRVGARGWGWRDVLPYFRKLESDLDFGGDLHGRDGPTPIRRTPYEQWTPLAQAARQFAELRQMPFVADMNGDARDGYCALPMSNTERSRASAAICYLDAAIRRRDNLTIVPDALATHLLFEGRRAIGVKATVGGAEKEFRAREIVLCGGAIQSPALLMRSGIGPAAASRAMGIEVTADLPGVGQNLQNHPVLFIGAHLRPHARQAAMPRTLQFSCFRLSSGLPDCPATDLVINLQSKSSWSALGAQIANLGPVLWKPFSRGQVTLVSPEVRQIPAGRIQLCRRRARPRADEVGIPLRRRPAVLGERAPADRPPIPGPLHRPACAASTRKRPPMRGNPRSSRGCSISAPPSATSPLRN